MHELLPVNLREPWKWRCWEENQSVNSPKRSGYARHAARVIGILGSSVESVEARNQCALPRRKGHPLRRERTQDRPLPQRRQCTEHLCWKQLRERSRVCLALKLQCKPKLNKKRHSWWRWNQHWHSCKRSKSPHLESYIAQMQKDNKTLRNKASKAGDCKSLAAEVAETRAYLDRENKRISDLEEV